MISMCKKASKACIALLSVDANRSVRSTASVKKKHMKPLKMQIRTQDCSSFWNGPMYEVAETEECDLPP